MRFDYFLKQLFCKHDMIIIKKEHFHISYSHKKHFNGWLQIEKCRKCGYEKTKRIPKYPKKTTIDS